MKKKLYFIFALLIFIIVLIVSCNKINILGANYIPPETDFKLPEEAIPGYIDVNPVPAKYGEVFGGFSKKFKYKDKWYILADYMYDYDPERKKLNKTDKNIILEIDDNANIMIYDKNSKGYSDCYYMNVIEEDRVLYEYYDYGTYSYSSRSFTTTDCKGEEDYHSFITGITFDNRIRTSSDLINWKFEGASNNIYKTFPSVSTDPNASFQGRFGASGYRTVEFKDYIYLIGLKEDFSEQNPSGCRSTDLGPFTVSKDVYYRVYKNKDTSVGANWEKIDKTPWGARSTKFVIGDFDVKIDKDKIYFSKGYREYYEYSPSDNKWAVKYESFRYDSRIWSSTDGVNWNLEYDEYTFYKATNVYDSDFKGLDRYLQNRIRTPEEPNWVKLDNGIYYKSDNTYSSQELNGKIYYYPTVPYAEIDAAYNRGEEYFTVSQKHLKGAGKNQFFAAREKPNEGDSWKLITPIDYTDKLMVWQSGGEKVMLNINNKAVQLVDYQQIEYMYNTIKDYSIVINDLRKTAKELRDGTHWSDIVNNGQGGYIKDVLLGMHYDVRADMLELMKSNRDYIMPHDAITHYTVEFKY